MKQNTFGVHFIVRKDRMDNKGLIPIYAKITLNGQILKFSLNHRIKPQDWVAEKEQPKKSTKTFKLINEAIEAFRNRIYQAYSKIVESNQALTIENLKSAFYGEKKETKVHTIIQTTIAHNSHFESMIGIKYSYGSYKNYKTSLKYFIEFIPLFYNKKDIALTLVNYKFCEAYFTFLTTKKSCKVNGANKQIQRLKKIINYAIKQGYISNNPMATFSLEFTPVNKVALTLEEIEKLHHLDLKRETLQNVCSIFLVQCYTGLAYSDIKRLSIKHIHRDHLGEYWIKMDRHKTQIAFSVPILKPALSIINRYLIHAEKTEHLLPVLSNQKMNDNLKIIQELAGISKSLTTHLARHTFATTITLGNGVPIETVSRMLGHTKLSTTQVYAKVLDNKIGEDMRLLKAKLKQQNKEL